ncbi:MAG: helix-turn-helix domain-containing protein [Armatimonadetes bacterium]|nr:helix-turn-helix domain-containing protein [Armatimonadota bacterium]
MSRNPVRQMELGEYSGKTVRRLRIQNLLLTENRFPSNLRVGQHSHIYPHFTIVLKGGFVEQYGEHKFVCSAGSVLLVPQDQSHCDIMGPDGTHSLSIEISRSLERFLSSESDLLTRPRVLRSSDLSAAIANLKRHFLTSTPSSSFEIHCAAMQVILAVLRSDTRPSDGPTWLATICNRLEEDLSQNQSLSELASLAGVSIAHLCRAFHRNKGMTIGDYVRRLRLCAAAERLSQSTDSIALIAAETGFADQAHLSRTFRQAYGLSPRAYRSQAN